MGKNIKNSKIRILFLPNWKVKKTIEVPEELQSPDYITKKEKYWFFKFFPEVEKVDVIDISSNNFIEKIENKFLHFYIFQTIKAILKIRKYDVVISHGMPSGILLALYRRIIKTKTKHIIIDIGSFNSAAETGKILKLNQIASKSIDGIIYHTSRQIEYYKKFYPWLVDKSKFIKFGTDIEYFKRDKTDDGIGEKEKYILSVGTEFRDYDTLIQAFKNSKIYENYKLKIIGSKTKSVEDKVEKLPVVEKRKLNKIIQNADFCVLPLKYRNFSFGQMTLLQQMYYGKVVITANVPSMMDYVKENETAILYEAENICELKEKIENIALDYELKEKIGNKASEIVKEEYKEEKMAINIYKFVKDIIK